MNVGWRVRLATETFVPFFMKSGTKSAAVRCLWIDRVERVERVERLGDEILTTDYTDLHGWMWWDWILVVFDLAV